MPINLFTCVRKLVIQHLESRVAANLKREHTLWDEYCSRMCSNEDSQRVLLIALALKCNFHSIVRSPRTLESILSSEHAPMFERNNLRNILSKELVILVFV